MFNYNLFFKIHLIRMVQDSCFFLKKVNKFQRLAGTKTLGEEGRHPDVIHFFVGRRKKKRGAMSDDANLSLENLRDILLRLEETIIFGLMERACVGLNPKVILYLSKKKKNCVAEGA